MKAPPRWKDLGFRVDGGGAVGVGFAERPRVCSIMRVAMLHPLTCLGQLNVRWKVLSVISVSSVGAGLEWAWLFASLCK